MADLTVDLDKCNGCGMCARSCPYGAIEIVDKKAIISDPRCVLCAACLEACKFEALSGDFPVKEVPDFSDYSGIMVFAESREGKFHKSAYELVGCARLLADDLGEDVTVVGLGKGLKDLGQDLISHGADKCLLFEDDSFDIYQTCSYTHALCEIISQRKPSVLLIAATHLGRDLAPRIARRLELGLTADCTRLSIDPEQKLLLQTRPAFGGNIMATIVSKYSRPQAATVRPGIMKALPADPSRKGEVLVESAALEGCKEFTRLLECIKDEAEGPDLSDAKIIVAGGRPICSEQGIKVLKDFADAIGGQVACTRIVVEEGYLPASHQVGQTGKTVRPEVYFACGVSGAIQHRAGMDGARRIVAINKDPDAAIFEVADFAIVGDLYEILPAISKAIRNG